MNFVICILSQFNYIACLHCKNKQAKKKKKKKTEQKAQKTKTKQQTTKKNNPHPTSKASAFYVGNKNSFEKKSWRHFISSTFIQLEAGSSWCRSSDPKSLLSSSSFQFQSDSPSFFLRNSPTVSLQRGKTSSTSVLHITLNNLIARFL